MGCRRAGARADAARRELLGRLQKAQEQLEGVFGRIGDGSHQDDGCYVLMKEVVDNTIDEFIMGNGKEVHIGLDGNRVTVRDFDFTRPDFKIEGVAPRRPLRVRARGCAGRHRSRARGAWSPMRRSPRGCGRS